MKPSNPARAQLSSKGCFTQFSFGRHVIRFRTSEKLERYMSVKSWDNGYLVVTVRYRGLPDIEDYIDLSPILENLYFDPAEFLKPIEGVDIVYE